MMYYGVFFFFKQKTAYEMRISDWSSDVCSSDLQQSAATRHSNEGGASDGHQEVAWICGITFTADGGGAETAGRSRALAPKGHRNLATGSRSNALQDRKSTRLNSSH